MMRTMTIVLGSIGAFVAGCAAPPSATPSENYDVVSLGSQVDSPQAAPMAFRLGAGDRLGEAVFVSYVAYVRANWQQQQQYASGEQTR
jgi:hypothetical protein